mmetsp:Transcript_8775/g.21536  ORF Transcript_8775/g.21536 Transcript_8775/m.21536 type:complete len:240 (+) Transcript_8775:1749-2468(+)
MPQLPSPLKTAVAHTSPPKSLGLLKMSLERVAEHCSVPLKKAGANLPSYRPLRAASGMQHFMPCLKQSILGLPDPCGGRLCILRSGMGLDTGSRLNTPLSLASVTSSAALAKSTYLATSLAAPKPVDSAFALVDTIPGRLAATLPTRVPLLARPAPSPAKLRGAAAPGRRRLPAEARPGAKAPNAATCSLCAPACGCGQNAGPDTVPGVELWAVGLLKRVHSLGALKENAVHCWGVAVC